MRTREWWRLLELLEKAAEATEYTESDLYSEAYDRVWRRLNGMEEQ